MENGIYSASLQLCTVARYSRLTFAFITYIFYKGIEIFINSYYNIIISSTIKLYILEHQKIALENVIINSEAGHMYGTIKAILTLFNYKQQNLRCQHFIIIFRCRTLCSKKMYFYA